MEGASGDEGGEFGDISFDVVDGAAESGRVVGDTEELWFTELGWLSIHFSMTIWLCFPFLSSILGIYSPF